MFFQPHSAPGVYARAFLEGRLSGDDLAHYRQELVAPAHGARGLTSYPHPQLMPDFWQFPTGSMGIGPINAIYQARFMRYLQHRGLLAPGSGASQRRSSLEDTTQQRRVWGFFGDGEMDEPESIAALSLAAREQLDNCTFVINCNLQRLDGPVRGNGRIVDELESVFAGAGWHVIKCLWSSDWDVLFARDHGHALMRAFARHRRRPVPDPLGQGRRVQPRGLLRPERRASALVADLRDEDIDRLRRGGHDAVKIHAAFAAAVGHAGQPTVVLAKTMKGYGMGERGAGPHDDAPGEEARQRRPARVPRPLRAADERRRHAVARLLQAGRRQRRDALPA